MKIIYSFTGKYRFLSNFYPSPVRYLYIKYPTAEHAYQAQKTENLTLRKKISLVKTPGEAKRLGRQLQLRPDWNHVKLNTMYEIVYIKFSSWSGIRQKLLETDSDFLVERNNWHDNFWGSCRCDKCFKIIGQNKLGYILMDIRKKLSES